MHMPLFVKYFVFVITFAHFTQFRSIFSGSLKQDTEKKQYVELCLSFRSLVRNIYAYSFHDIWG